MTWLEKKDNWLPRKQGKRAPMKETEKSYSIPEVGELLAVSRDTVYKWLAFDCPEEAVIPPSVWYRLPNGRIRIREWIVLKIQQGNA